MAINLLASAYKWWRREGFWDWFYVKEFREMSWCGKWAWLKSIFSHDFLIHTESTEKINFWKLCKWRNFSCKFTINKVGPICNKITIAKKEGAGAIRFANPLTIRIIYGLLRHKTHFPISMTNNVHLEKFPFMP